MQTAYATAMSDLFGNVSGINTVLRASVIWYELEQLLAFECIHVSIIRSILL